MFIKTKAWMVKKIDPEDDTRVDTFWKNASLKERRTFATLDKLTLFKKIKDKLKKRCNCKDCRFSKISYYDPQAKIIDIYVHQLEMGLCPCHRRHRDFSDDDHKDADYIDNPTCRSYDTILTGCIRIEGDKLQVLPEALDDEFFVKYREQREWRSLYISPALPPNCGSCHGEAREQRREEKKEEKKEDKIEKEEKKEIGSVSEELMKKEEKEKKEPKITCDECRSRITFELSVVAAIEEKVILAHRAKLLEQQSQAVCELLLQEEGKKEKKKQTKRTAAHRAHHHHCSQHKAPTVKEGTKRRKGSAREVEEKEKEEEMTEVPSVVYPANNQVLILDSLNPTQENIEEFTSEDWTVVGKTKKKPDSPPSPTLEATVPVLEAPKIPRKSKPIISIKPEQAPASKTVLPKQSEWKGWKIPSTDVKAADPMQISQNIPAEPIQTPIQSESIVQIPQCIQTPTQSESIFPIAQCSQTPIQSQSISKVIQPPVQTMLSAYEVQAATNLLVRAIKSLTLASSSGCLPSPHLELRTAVFDSLNTLSLECDSLLHCNIEQVCCEEESCVPCPREDGCNCTYHSNCFSLPTIFDSGIWNM